MNVSKILQKIRIISQIIWYVVSERAVYWDSGEIFSFNSVGRINDFESDWKLYFPMIQRIRYSLSKVDGQKYMVSLNNTINGYFGHMNLMMYGRGLKWTNQTDEKRILL